MVSEQFLHMYITLRFLTNAVYYEMKKILRHSTMSRNFWIKYTIITLDTILCICAILSYYIMMNIEFRIT